MFKELHLGLKYISLGSTYLGRSHNNAVLTNSPPTNEIRVRILAWPHVGKLVVDCHWLAIQNLDQLYVLVSSALLTTNHNITDKALGMA